MGRVLCLGGAGFIGSHLCDELLAHGYEVRVLDSLDPQVHPKSQIPQYLNPAVELCIGDVGDRRAVRRAIEDMDYVVHLAAKVGVGQSAYDIADYVFNNTYGTAVLLEQLQQHPPKRLIVASSMSVYGEGDRVYHGELEGGGWQPIPTDEDKVPELQSIYALTKYDQERLCLLFGRAFNVPAIALRFFNVYGTRQSLSNPYTGVMAIFASRLLNGQPSIIFEDGLQRRDFVYVSDIVRGIRLALESDISNEVINLGSGTSHTVLEIAEKLSRALDVNIFPLVTGQHRVGDIRHCFADITKAQELLDYWPKVTVDEGIVELVEWLRTQVAVDKLSEHLAELEDKGLLK